MPFDSRRLAAASDGVTSTTPRSAEFLFASANNCPVAQRCEQSSQGRPFDSYDSRQFFIRREGAEPSATTRRGRDSLHPIWT
jgi:hypothetical protein